MDIPLSIQILFSGILCYIFVFNCDMLYSNIILRYSLVLWVLNSIFVTCFEFVLCKTYSKKVFLGKKKN